MDSRAFPYHCGSRTLGDFFSGVNNVKIDYLKDNQSYNTFFSIYTNRGDQYKAYNKLKKIFKILYQSPILNPKTTYQNPYFIVIYLNEKP